MKLLKQNRVILTIGLIFAVACSLGAVPATVPATDPASNNPPPLATARGTVEKILADVTAILRDTKLTKPQRSDKVRDIAYANIDFETLSQLTLGRNWRPLSAKQQADFVTEFRKHLAATYAHITDDYDNQDLTVTGDHKESNGDWTVQTKIVGHKTGNPNQDTTKVDYRLRQKDNQWKVIDVIVENVSLVANFRSQFQDIISNGGFDHLMQLLKDKNAKEAN